MQCLVVILLRPSPTEVVFCTAVFLEKGTSAGSMIRARACFLAREQTTDCTPSPHSAHSTQNEQIAWSRHPNAYVWERCVTHPPYRTRAVRFFAPATAGGVSHSFVLGVQSKHLRSTKLSDLVFRADGAVPSSRRAMVKVRQSANRPVSQSVSQSVREESACCDALFYRSSCQRTIRIWMVGQSVNVSDACKTIKYTIRDGMACRSILCFQPRD